MDSSLTMVVVQLAMMLVTSGLSAGLGWVSSKYKASRKSAEDDEREHAAMREACMLYAGRRLDELCTAYAAADTHTSSEAQAIIGAWDVYHGCGGDGVRAALVEKTIGVRVED